MAIRLSSDWKKAGTGRIIERFCAVAGAGFFLHSGGDCDSCYNLTRGADCACNYLTQRKYYVA